MVATTAMITALPKIELHCHIEGTMRPATVAELAAAAGIVLPVEDPLDLYRFGNLTEFLDAFWLVQSTLTDRDAWARLAYESIVDGAAHGLVHRETFFTPARHLAAGQELGDIIAGLDEGLGAAERDTGATARLIFDIDREFGAAIALSHVERLVELIDAGAPGTDRIIGMGMDSTELGVDPASFTDAYRLAAAAGLRLTAHQGENSPAAAAAIAVDVLGAERLDHGFSVLEDLELTKRLAERRLPFTVCPNANVRINPDRFAHLAEHPVDAMRTAGLLVTLNTDDPAMIGLDLTEEFELTAAEFGYSWDDLVGLSLDAVEASWLDDDEQRRLARRVRDGAAAAATASHP
jgi:adenosine deaminase